MLGHSNALKDSNWQMCYLSKNTRLEKIKIPESKDEVNGSHDEYFSLFEGAYAQSFPLRKISLRVSSIHEKNRVVCTLRDRFTDMCPTFSEKTFFSIYFLFRIFFYQQKQI
jgi:hypothetical protein